MLSLCRYVKIELRCRTPSWYPDLLLVGVGNHPTPHMLKLHAEPSYYPYYTKRKCPGKHVKGVAGQPFDKEIMGPIHEFHQSSHK